MADMQKLNETKNRIINALRINGPSFPAKVSRETGISPLFVAAILSELVAEKKLLMSAMKVGSSPIYILPGQEALLEKFSQYLNHKEREAFELIKSSQLLNDEQQDPAIRVALRKISDFAVPISVRSGEQQHLFWKYFLFPDNEARYRIESILEPVKQPEREVVKKVQEPEMPLPELKAEKPEPVKEKKKFKKDSDFSLKLKDYLLGKEIELLQELNSKPKEFSAKIRVDTPFGKQEFLLVAKDKKKITEDELIIAVQKAHLEKMPALIMSSGEPDKTAKEYLKEWRNLIKFEKIKL